MSAVLLGVVAALAWGLHDLLIRFVSRSLGSLQSVLIVFILGAIAIATAMVVRGEAVSVAPDKLWIMALTGITYALGFVWLFKAFAIGPVALVSPIVGAYPVLVMVWAVANGAQPSASDWLAVAAITVGVALVARFATEAQPEPGHAMVGIRTQAIVYSGLSGLGFAASLTAGQAAVQDGGELNVTLVSRAWSMAIMAAWCLRDRGSFSGAKPWLPVLMLMGVLDALALSAVISAGKIEGAEFATVVGSCFGAVTVVLAIIFLKERLNLLQLLGMLMILGGVVVLSGRY